MHSRIHKGFSLVEMAIVLAIVALLLGGLLPTISAQIDIQHLKETRKQMEDIRAALTGFAVSNGRLPCPDTDTPRDGIENITAGTAQLDTPETGQNTVINSCTNQSGGLPYNQLGVEPKDIYNGSFTYRITPTFAQKDEIRLTATSTLLTTKYFSLSTTGDLRVCTTAACSTILTSDAAAIVVSSGKNWAQPASTDEAENTDADKDFVSRDFGPDFDDLVIWISPAALKNRMVAAGKLP